MAGASHKCQIGCDTLEKRYDLPTGHIASLEIDGHIISCHVATAIKEASYHRESTEYITQRTGWQDEETHHTIDWVACSRAGKQLSLGQGLTVFKLEFALFATMSQRHQMEQGIDHRCPRCHHFQETLVHVFQCPKALEICKGVLTRALASIRKKLTCTFVIDMLESGVSQWSTSGQVQWPGISPGPTDDNVQLTFQAFQEQQQIGWDQGIRGQWSKKWGQANGLYCISRLHQGDTDIHARWMSSLVKSMWQYGIDQLIGRNKYIYGKTKEEQQEKKNQEVDAQVRRIHHLDRNKVQQQDRHLFEMSVTKRLAKSLNTKKKWIECVNTAYEAWTKILAT